MSGKQNQPEPEHGGMYSRDPDTGALTPYVDEAVREAAKAPAPKPVPKTKEA
jgi:hypothetical protein